MTTAAENTVKVYEATLSRRQFVKTGGALVVGVAFVGPSILKAQGFQAPKVTGAPFKNSLDPTQLSSWIEIHPDNTVLIRTGKSDFGQGTTFTAYRQIVADELSVPFESITTVVAGTHRSDARWQWRLRFPRPRHSQHPQSRCVHLSSASRSRFRTPQRPERSTHCQRRRLFQRRQIHLLRRPRQRSTTKTHHPRQRRPNRHYGIESRRRSADETCQRLHRHRQIPPELHNHLQSHGKRNLGHRHPPSRNVAWTHGSSQNARLHARLCRPARQIQIPQFASSCERKSRRSRLSNRMGSHSGFAASRRRNQMDATGRACPVTKSSTILYARKPIGPLRKLQKATPTKVMYQRRSLPLRKSYPPRITFPS